MNKDIVVKLYVATVIIFFIFVLGLFSYLDFKYNNEIHYDDISITEWVSQDGVHYWYKSSGYQSILAPRYDSNGNLVIDR